MNNLGKVCFGSHTISVSAKMEACSRTSKIHNLDIFFRKENRRKVVERCRTKISLIRIAMRNGASLPSRRSSCRLAGLAAVLAGFISREDVR